MDYMALCAVPEWPRSLGAPKAEGIVRSRPEDFIVEEMPRVQPSGDGGHLWLEVQKRGANTDWIAGQLARAAGCHAREVGYAGMKDRHAVTTQWFSVPVPAAKNPDWAAWRLVDAVIIQAIRHDRKLKRGVLCGNRFEITIRDVRGDTADLPARLEQLKSRGMPNYFGAQRFGKLGDNAARGARWLKEGGRLSRARRSIYLSALRSLLFNHVLADRVRNNDWDQLLDGEAGMLDGTHSVFLCDMPDSDLERRCREFDIHPTGPLPGAGGFLPAGAAAARESAVLQPYRELVDALCESGMASDRRSFRLHPSGLEWNLQPGRLELHFTLPAGAYATSLVEELLRTGDNPQG